MRTYLSKLLFLTLAVAWLCAVQASALEYSYDGPDDFLFAQPTSDSAIYEEENLNVDRSKNVALVAPGFGSPTSYLPGSGEALTPNLIPGALSGGFLPGTSIPPAADASSGTSSSQGNFSYVTRPSDSGSVGFTDVTQDSYYSNGSLGTLKIPAIGVNSKIVEGTGSAALAKGVGHFTGTSIWNGNVCVAAHNRGINAIFGKLHTLSIGDEIILTTKEGTRTYSVTSVEKVSETDTSGTASTSDNRITLYTCVRDQRDLRYCVQAVEA
jgi:sortase A